MSARSPERRAPAKRGGIPDVIAPDLSILYCGINPGLYSAAVGHHFARPGNRFWKTLHIAKLTPRLLSPFEDRQLLEYGQGITNLVARSSAEAAELSDDELKAGLRRLETKVRRFRPRFVAFLGVGAYRTATGKKKAAIGPQEELLASAQVWLLANPSGRAAAYQLPDLVAQLCALQKEVRQQNQMKSR